MIARLRAENFAAVVVDLWGYADQGVQLAGERSTLLGPPPI